MDNKTREEVCTQVEIACSKLRDGTHSPLQKFIVQSWILHAIPLMPNERLAEVAELILKRGREDSEAAKRMN